MPLPELRCYMEPLRWQSCVVDGSRFSPWLNFRPLLCRTGRVQSAVGCATAACVARRRAAAPPETWWDWPASMATTMSTSTWKGRLPDTVGDDNAHVVSSCPFFFFFFSFAYPVFQHSEGAAVMCRERRTPAGSADVQLLITVRFVLT